MEKSVTFVILLGACFWTGCSENKNDSQSQSPVEDEESSPTSGSTGESENTDQDDKSNFDCIEKEISLKDLDSPTPAGITARKVFESATGTFQFTLQKIDVQNPITTFSPDSDGVSATISLDFKPDGLRFIDSKVPAIPEGVKLKPHCPDIFTSRVIVRFRSEDGAFAEEWEATLSHEVPGSSDNHKGEPDEPETRLTTVLPNGPLVGTFTVEQPKSYPAEKTEKHNVQLLVLWDKTSIKGGALRARWWGKPQKGPGKSTKKSFSKLDLYSLLPSK